MRGTIVALMLSLLVVPQVLSSSDRQDKGFATAQDEMLVIGNVNVRGASNGNIVVIVDESLSNGPDGVPDLVFRFAPKKKRLEYQRISFDIRGARVLFSSGRLAVISEDGHVVASLSIEKIGRSDPGFPVYGDRSSELPETVRISRGLGLQRQTPPRADDGSYLPVNIEENFIFGRGSASVQNEGDPDSCSAGGAGSTSCSISCGNGQGCSVSCSSGLYACCNCPHDCGCKL